MSQIQHSLTVVTTHTFTFGLPTHTPLFLNLITVADYPLLFVTDPFTTFHATPHCPPPQCPPIQTPSHYSHTHTHVRLPGLPTLVQPPTRLPQVLPPPPHIPTHTHPTLQLLGYLWLLPVLFLGCSWVACLHAVLDMQRRSHAPWTHAPGRILPHCEHFLLLPGLITCHC